MYVVLSCKEGVLSERPLLRMYTLRLLQPWVLDKDISKYINTYILLMLFFRRWSHLCVDNSYIILKRFSLQMQKKGGIDFRAEVWVTNSRGNRSKQMGVVFLLTHTGERRKIIQPTSLLDPKVEKLKDVSRGAVALLQGRLVSTERGSCFWTSVCTLL